MSTAMAKTGLGPESLVYKLSSPCSGHRLEDASVPSISPQTHWAAWNTDTSELGWVWLQELGPVSQGQVHIVMCPGCSFCKAHTLPGTCRGFITGQSLGSVKQSTPVWELSEDRPGSRVYIRAGLVRARVSPGWRESDPPRPHMVGAAQQGTACQGC